MAPHLIVLNGPPASGKSTLARRYADAHPLALVIDVDVVRSWLGRWPDHAGEAGLAARALATVMARAHLAAGHDVVVAQLYGRPDHLDELAVVAREVGARHHEVVLIAGADETVARYQARSGSPAGGVHGPPASRDDIIDLHGRVVALATSRPGTVTMEPVWGDLDASYSRLEGAIGIGIDEAAGD